MGGVERRDSKPIAKLDAISPRSGQGESPASFNASQIGNISKTTAQ
jgi:hypothetical protein